MNLHESIRIILSGDAEFRMIDHFLRPTISDQEKGMARITGIGGVFFKSKGDHKALAAWYQKHLGIALEPFGGAILRWPDDKAEDKGLTVWHVAGSASKWF